jgi:sporulation protein YlmC with PRC-barrel domain
MASKVKGTHDIRHVMSASSLTGDSVVNSRGDTLGTIEDIMIHIDSGRIAYAVLSFGGFLGMGDKLFAIPWEALTLDEDNKQFVLDVAKEKLENAPGFDKSNWPDMADPQFGKEIYGFYGYEQSWRSESRQMGTSRSSHPTESEREDCLDLGTC